MNIRRFLSVSFLLSGAFTQQAFAQQAPFGRPDVPVSNADRVYAADQTSNTVSVIDPYNNQLLGVIRLGNPVPGALSPLYRGQLLVHGLGFSPGFKDTCRRIHRLEFGNADRHGDQRSEGNNLCGTVASRGIFHA